MVNRGYYKVETKDNNKTVTLTIERPVDWSSKDWNKNLAKVRKFIDTL